MRFFYAVRKGRQEGVYQSWEECEEQIKNFADAQFRKFKCKKEAEAWYLTKDKVISKKEVMVNNSDDQEKISLEHLDKTDNIYSTGSK